MGYMLRYLGQAGATAAQEDAGDEEED